MNPSPTHIPLYYWTNLPALNTGQYIAQRLVYPMKTVHTVQSFLNTFCQNGLQFRIICACKAVDHCLLAQQPPTPTPTLVMSSLLPPLHCARKWTVRGLGPHPNARQTPHSSLAGPRPAHGDYPHFQPQHNRGPQNASFQRVCNTTTKALWAQGAHREGGGVPSARCHCGAVGRLGTGGLPRRWPRSRAVLRAKGKKDGGS